MERVIERREDLGRALKNFHESIQIFNESKIARNIAPAQIRVNRNSVIKTFELCYDLLWKSLKDFIEKKLGILVTSPKKVFQEARTQNLIDDREFKEMLAVVDDRNLTARTYDEDFAESVAQRAIAHFDLMKKVAEKIKF